MNKLDNNSSSEPIKVLLMLPIRKEDQYYVPDVGLGYLATALRNKLKDKIHVELLVNNLNISDDNFGEYLTSNNFDIIGIKTFATSINDIKNSISLIRKFSPGTVIVLGGPQATGDPDNILKYLHADYAFEGESEIGFPIFVEELYRGELIDAVADCIPGLIRKKDDEIIRNDNVCINQLDSIGFPAWDLMDPNDFDDKYNRYPEKFPIAPLITTRGCPFKCTFCCVGDTTLRRRTVSSIISEIEMLKNDYGIKEFAILDSNFAHKKEHALEFCKEIMKSGLNVPWRVLGGIRVDSIDEELLGWLKKAGCYQLWIGVESGSDRMLKKVIKGFTVEETKRKVDLINKSGIDSGGFFMLGLPGETKKETQMTINLAMTLPIKHLAITVYNPAPGSVLYNELKQEGKLDDINFELLDGRKYKNNFAEYSGSTLSAYRDIISVLFYFRPSILMSLLKDFDSPKKVLRLFRIFWRVLQHKNSW